MILVIQLIHAKILKVVNHSYVNYQYNFGCKVGRKYVKVARVHFKNEAQERLSGLTQSLKLKLFFKYGVIR